MGGTKERLLRQQRRRCWYCGFNSYQEDWEIEHQVPRSRGGSDGVENLVVACKPCNRQKRAMTVDEYRKSLLDAIDAQLYVVSLMVLPFACKGDGAAREIQRLIEKAREIALTEFSPHFAGEVQQVPYADLVLESEGPAA